jgi:murein DD-endopeptidase MepM/ murein hydrolase activator NlpD
VAASVNLTRDTIFTLGQAELQEKKIVTLAEADYEYKLHELQARLVQAQQSLGQLDSLRNQLLQLNSLPKVNQKDVVSGSLSQEGFVDTALALGGPLKISREIFSPDETYGVRLDRTLQDSIGLQTQVLTLQKAFAETQVSMNGAPTGSPLPFEVAPSSGLGYRIDPFTRQIAWHDGTDFPAAYGTPILATADGIVIKAGWSGEYGNLVDVQHRNGVVTRYAHAQELMVRVGQKVKKSQLLAKVGSTGRSTGPHLHYEILRDGAPAS